MSCKTMKSGGLITKHEPSEFSGSYKRHVDPEIQIQQGEIVFMIWLSSCTNGYGEVFQAHTLVQTSIENICCEGVKIDYHP